MAGADEVGGLPTGAHEAGGGVGVGAEEEMANLVGEGMTEDACQIDMGGLVKMPSALVEEIGVATDTVGGEIRDA